MAYQKLWIVIMSLYLSVLSVISTIFYHLKSFLFKTNWVSIFSRIPDTLVSLYFRLCGLSPCTVDIDDKTTVHFRTANNRRSNKPNLVLVHGYGANSLWQFFRQFGPLSRKFNLYVPDLLFFGKSYTHRSDRSECFQAKCVVEGLKRLRVDRYSVYGISYGGFVAYHMAEMCPETVKKVAIGSSRVVWNDQQKEELLRANANALEILVAKNPHDLRMLVDKENRMEKLELLEHLLANKGDRSLPILTQKTLIIWGDQDNFFPLYMAYQLQRHLGPKSKLEINKDTGHVANFQSSNTINRMIKGICFGC